MKKNSFFRLKQTFLLSWVGVRILASRTVPYFEKNLINVSFVKSNGNEPTNTCCSFGAVATFAPERRAGLWSCWELSCQ